MNPKQSSGGSRLSAGERGGGGGGVRGGPFGFHFGLKVRGFRAPRAPSPGSTTAFYSKGTEALNKDLLSKRTSRAG